MRRYSFVDTILSVNGVEIVGWDEGDDVIQMKRRNDAASDKVGAAGDMLVALSADKSGEITFKLLQASPSNAFLFDVAGRQEGGNLLFVPLYIRFFDTYRQDIGVGSGGYVKKLPDFVRGQNSNTSEWVVVVERLDLLAGGDV